ncbi:ECF transporter S component [candidate division KSB1 bacterium]|nr:ECF transporter S component [candidate division KSB1 bacterium]
MQSRTQQIILSGLFIAIGVILPILFHMIGLGAFMLPMFWPICISAFYLNPLFAILTGVLTPMISMLITGMPPAPVVYLMIGELAALGGIISMLRIRSKLGIFWILLIGLAGSRTVLFALTMILAPLIGLPGRLAGLYQIVEGIPGLIAILIMIPFLLHRMKKRLIVK